MTAVTLWCIELHLLIQIIVNRVSLLIVSRRRASTIKWGSCAIILFINIGVYCIWVPARLQISQTYMDINDIFDRCEKAVYLLLDAALNFYFCYLVKIKLIRTGITKYTPLYKFNMSIVFVSLSMDALLIGMMSMTNQLIYVQFHPLCFMVKLNIEMSMADMISRVTRAPRQGLAYGGNRDCNAEYGISGSNGSGGGIGGSKHKSLAGTTIVANGNTLAHQKQNQIDCTASRILDEARKKRSHTSTSRDQLYHAWVSGGTSSPVHDLRGKRMKWLDAKTSEDLEAGVTVDEKPGDTMDEMNVITKNTTVHITWEGVSEGESSIASSTMASSETDSIEGLRRQSS